MNPQTTLSGKVALVTGRATGRGLELASYGITVNRVFPGWIPTERHQDCSQEDLDDYEQTIPMGKRGEASEVAHTVAYLCESGASFVTGQTICVNGGRSAL